MSTWFKIALRSLLRHKTYAGIDIAGLALDDLLANTDFPSRVAISYATLLPQLNRADWLSVNEAHNVLVKLPAGMG